jgi:radical SAM protein with 4Fe4S-binding SPASM domain
MTAAAYTHTPFPQQLVIEATAGCNQKCINCGRTYMVRPKKTMKPAMFHRIVDEVAAESPYTEIWPTFMGEAFLLGKKLFDMIEYARKVGCQKITLNTNGTRLSEQVIASVISCGIDRLIVSCDAHTPETHRIVRPAINPATASGLDGIYHGVLLLLEAMHRQNITTPLIEMQFSIFDENQHEVDDFRKFWLEKGVIVKVRPKVFWSGVVEGGNQRITFKNRTPCLWAMDAAAIQWNGNVVMCPIDCDGKYVAGNIEMQTLKEIWNGPLKWNREQHLRQRYSELPEVCRLCPDWQVKKAHAYFPNEAMKADYEAYVRKGRTFMENHFWNEQQELLAK